MQRALFWCLAFCLLFSLSACGGGSEGDDSGADDGGPASPSLEPFIHVDPSPGSDYALGLDSHSDGSTVMCGWFPGTHTWAAGKPEETSRTALGANDGYVCRYDPSGRLQWIQVVLGSDSVSVDRVVALDDASCVVMGHTRDQAIFAAGTAQQVVTPSGLSTFVARYLSDGTLAWAKIIPGVEADVIDGCAFPDGSVAFCGLILATSKFANGEPEQTDLDEMSEFFATDFVARYAPDGTLVYAVAPTDSTGPSYASGLSALADNSVIVTGFFQAPITIGAGTPAEEMFTNDGIDDGYVIRLSPTGDPLWGRHISGPGRVLPATAATLPNGTIGLMGIVTEDLMTFNAGEADALVSSGGADGSTYVAAYSSEGSPLWARHIAYANSAT